jgi:Spy/CpxP family protein refolding chaperone
MKTLKVIGLLALIFAAGFSGGVVATRILVRRMVQVAVAHPEVTREVVRTNIEQNLFRKLRLDPEQRQQVHLILKDSHDKLRDIREEFQPKLNTVVLDARTNISAVLKPEQQKRFEEFLAENRQFLPYREPPPPQKK